jgi:hypothetical protein
VEATRSPATIGSNRSPDAVADTPWTYCRNVGRNVNDPSIANPTTKLSGVATANTGFRNSRIGRVGSGTRSSTNTNATSTTTEPTTSPTIGADAQG